MPRHDKAGLNRQKQLDNLETFGEARSEFPRPIKRLQNRR